jgi:hypothetical protein
LHALRQQPEQHTHRRPVTALDSLLEYEERKQQSSSSPVAICHEASKGIFAGELVTLR